MVAWLATIALLPGTNWEAQVLRVDAKGELVRGGRPVREFGVNYVSAFTRHLANPDDTTFREGFRELRKRNLRAARIWLMGYWPSENKLTVENRAEYLRRLDAVVREAEAQGIGLIPSFFFNLPCVPDLVGEPVNRWGDSKSKTHAFMRQFVADVVGRYRTSPAVWAWEFGNEMNLQADLPNAKEHRPPIVPTFGTPTSRSAEDDLTHEAMRLAVSAFAREVRRIDRVRAIVTGNTFPRPTAWHQMREGSWGTDSEGQFAEMLVADSPDLVNTLSGHLYAGDLDRSGRKVSLSDFLAISQRVAKSAKKPLIIGEFGMPGPDALPKVREMVAAIRQQQVPLALLWVYDFSPQDSDWNVTTSNARQALLELLSEANRDRGLTVPVKRIRTVSVRKGALCSEPEGTMEELHVGADCEAPAQSPRDARSARNPRATGDGVW